MLTIEEHKHSCRASNKPTPGLEHGCRMSLSLYLPIPQDHLKSPACKREMPPWCMTCWQSSSAFFQANARLCPHYPFLSTLRTSRRCCGGGSGSSCLRLIEFQPAYERLAYGRQQLPAIRQLAYATQQVRVFTDILMISTLATPRYALCQSLLYPPQHLVMMQRAGPRPEFHHPRPQVLCCKQITRTFTAAK